MAGKSIFSFHDRAGITIDPKAASDGTPRLYIVSKITNSPQPRLFGFANDTSDWEGNSIFTAVGNPSPETFFQLVEPTVGTFRWKQGRFESLIQIPGNREGVTGHTPFDRHHYFCDEAVARSRHPRFLDQRQKPDGKTPYPGASTTAKLRTGLRDYCLGKPFEREVVIAFSHFFSIVSGQKNIPAFAAGEAMSPGLIEVLFTKLKGGTIDLAEVTWNAGFAAARAKDSTGFDREVTELIEAFCNAVTAASVASTGT